jgi:hypothetical protein
VLCLACIPHRGAGIGIGRYGLALPIGPPPPKSPELGTNSIDWAQLISFYLKTETECSLRNAVFWKINRTADNVQKHDICSVLTYEGVFQEFIKVEMVLTVPPDSLISADWLCLQHIKSDRTYHSVFLEQTYNLGHKYKLTSHKIKIKILNTFGLHFVWLNLNFSNSY